MRYVILLVLLVCSHFIHAQTWQSTLKESTGVIFEDFDGHDDVLFVVGFEDPNQNFEYDGLIYRSTDGGENWEKLQTGYSADVAFQFVNMVDKNTIFITHESARRILRSQDGGDNWDTIAPKGPFTNFKVDDMHFISSKKGFGTWRGRLFSTQDGGANWDTISLPQDVSHIYTFSVIDEDNIVVALDDEIYRTDDGGDTWKDISNGFALAEVIHFNDAMTGFYISGQMMYATDDGGETWDSRIKYDATFEELSGIQFYDNKHGIVTLDTETYYTTQDGGETWQEQNTTLSYFGLLTEPHFLDKNTVVTLTDAGIGTNHVGKNNSVKYGDVGIGEVIKPFDVYISDGVLHLTKPLAGDAVLQISNIQGQNLCFQVVSGSQHFELPSQFRQSGVYFVSFQLENNLVFTQKVSSSACR